MFFSCIYRNKPIVSIIIIFNLRHINWKTKTNKLFAGIFMQTWLFILKVNMNTALELFQSLIILLDWAVCCINKPLCIHDHHPLCHWQQCGHVHFISFHFIKTMTCYCQVYYRDLLNTQFLTKMNAENVTKMFKCSLIPSDFSNLFLGFYWQALFLYSFVLQNCMQLKWNHI